MERYLVCPIRDQHIDSINDAVVVCETDDLMTALRADAESTHPFRCGILDRKTGLLDVGFGFGVPYPDHVV